MNAEQPVTHLSRDEAQQFLSDQRFGRLAMILADSPEIVPVNFVVDLEAADSPRIYIRTDAGNKLFAAAVGRPVALEADAVDDDHATSVIAYGGVRIVKDKHEVERVSALEIKPWVATYKSEIITIDVERISGRRFVLGPEPANPTSEVPG